MKYSRQILILLLVIVSLLVVRLMVRDHLTMEYLQAHKQELLAFIHGHYQYSMVLFVLLYACTALVLPGALVLTIAGGMAFGVVPTVFLVNFAATIGATLAFLCSRLLLGDLLRGRFVVHMQRFNREISRHGHRYLLVLRIMPIIPFFVVNYCAAVTKVPLKTFVWTTSVGILPGSLVYAYVGEQMRTIEVANDLLSGKIIAGAVLLCIFILAPIAAEHISSRRH